METEHIDDTVVCVQCRRMRAEIRANKYICGEVSYEGELTHEWPRHRFKPYSKRELELMMKDEMEYLAQMQGLVDFVEEQDNPSTKP